MKADYDSFLYLQLIKKMQRNEKIFNHVWKKHAQNTVEYTVLVMGPPDPDAEAYETNPDAGKG